MYPKVQFISTDTPKQQTALSQGPTAVEFHPAGLTHRGKGARQNQPLHGTNSPDPNKHNKFSPSVYTHMQYVNSFIVH